MDENQITESSISFPDPEDIRPLAIAFARMMFAHAAFESEVRQLQEAITCVRGFGEKPENQRGGARARPDRMAKLIAEHRGAIPEAEPIKNILTEAVAVCDDRNLLAHGEWWRFDPITSTIDVRGGTQWNDDGFPEHKPWTEAEIVAVTERFKDFEIELYKLRRAIGQRTPCCIHVADISTFEEAFGTVGERVGPRTGPDKRTQDDKEWYVVRRFLQEALLATIFATPLALCKTRPPRPDFRLELGDEQSPAFIEITEATQPQDQREMTEFERSGKSAMSQGALGGRFPRGAGSESAHAWASDIIDAIERKSGKAIYSMPGESRHLVIYPNSNASSLILDEAGERTAFSILQQAIDRRRTDYTGIANGCAIHVLGKHFVCFDLLGSIRLVARAA